MYIIRPILLYKEYVFQININRVEIESVSLSVRLSVVNQFY